MAALHFENEKDSPFEDVLQKQCEVLPVIINYTYFKEMDSFTSSKDKVWGRRLDMRKVGRGQEAEKQSTLGGVQVRRSRFLSTDQKLISKTHIPLPDMCIG